MARNRRIDRESRRIFLEILESRQFLSASLITVIHPDLTLTPSASTSSTPSGYSPAQIKQAYGFSSVSGDGTGQTIAIVDAYNDPNIAKDLAVFDAHYGLSAASLSVVSQTGSTTSLPKTDAGWAAEISLDVEWAHSIAPGAKILLVEAKSDSMTDLLSAVDYARSATGVSVVSMSWGTSEFTSETSYDSHFTTPTGHIGVTFIAASGDEGTYAGPEWPASSSKVLSVGGTSLVLDSSGNISSETDWSGSTGGVSRYESAGSYQSSATTSTKRSSPDVSYDANPNTGFAVYDSLAYDGISGWSEVGGTSAGAPQWAALIAIANQVRVAAGSSTLDGATGTLPALYSLYATSSSTNYATYTTSFNDIVSTVTTTTGGGRQGGFGFGGGGHGRWAYGFSNSATTTPVTTTTTTTNVGYDTVTGLGTPKAGAVIAALASYKTASTTTVATAKKAAVTKSASTSRLKKIRAAETFVSQSEESVLTLYMTPATPAVFSNLNTISIPTLQVTAALPVGSISAERMISTGLPQTAIPAASFTQALSVPAPLFLTTVNAQVNPSVFSTASIGEHFKHAATAIQSTATEAAAVIAHAAEELAQSAEDWAFPVALAGTIVMASYIANRVRGRQTGETYFNFVEPVYG